MRFLVPCLAAALLLGACSNAKETLGLTKQAPDEFAVVKRAPLSMPPEYTLRPPRPGAPRPQELEPSMEARQAIFGTQPAQEAGYYSEGESILLRDAGAEEQQIDPAIRQRVDNETEQAADSNQPVVDKLLGHVGMGGGENASVINPVEEAERIKKEKEANKALSAPVTTEKE